MITTDALVIGAGPIGLFQTFQLGLREIRVHLIEALPRAGGQCAELYGDKPIYDIPALPLCTGHELTQRLLQQIRPFAPIFHFEQRVSQVESTPSGRFHVHTHTGLVLDCGAIALAAGVGAFVPRPLKVAGLDVFEGHQVFYQPQHIPSAAIAGQHVVIAGATEQALGWATQLAQGRAMDAPNAAKTVCLIHRRNSFDAPPQTLAPFQQAIDAGHLQLIVGQVTGYQVHDGRVCALSLLTANGDSHAVTADTVVVLQGLSPKLGPFAQWGLALERKQVSVDTTRFQTTVPGIFAIGDVVHYPGKQRLILCGFHEAALAAAGIAGHLRPGADRPLEYTTSSARLHRLLGV